MKTTISVPEHIYRTADNLAVRLGISRSELYCRAIRDLLARQGPYDITARLNAIYGKPGTFSALEPELAVLQAFTLAKATD